MVNITDRVRIIKEFTNIKTNKDFRKVQELAEILSSADADYDIISYTKKRCVIVDTSIIDIDEKGIRSKIKYSKLKKKHGFDVTDFIFIGRTKNA